MLSKAAWGKTKEEYDVLFNYVNIYDFKTILWIYYDA